MNPERILVRGVNWLGDAVMTTPALQRLRERFPQARITLLTHEKLAGLWPGHPDVNDVLTFTANEGPWTISQRLKPEGFDLGVVLPNSPKSALELFLSGIPNRIGYATPWRRWLLTQAVPLRKGVVQMRKRSEAEIHRLVAGGRDFNSPTLPERDHHIFHYLQLVAALGANPAPLPPRLEVAPEEIGAAANKFGFASGTGETRPLFGLNAGAEYGPAKRWPRERFVEAAQELTRRASCRWLVFGGKTDMELAAGISAEIGSDVVNLAGRTSLRELCAALKACRVLLTNDTGPMHVAAAVGTPVVVPFGSTSPEFTGPGLPGDPRHQLVRSNAPCAPCFLRECPIDFRCMKGIAVERVVEAVQKAAA